MLQVAKKNSDDFMQGENAPFTLYALEIKSSWSALFGTTLGHTRSPLNGEDSNAQSGRVLRELTLRRFNDFTVGAFFPAREYFEHNFGVGAYETLGIVERRIKDLDTLALFSDF